MRILQMVAENVKKLKVVRITPDGNLVQITGANGQGKTSVLDAIFYALAGTSDIPAQPVRKGAGKGYVTLDLGDIVVTRKFSESGTTSLTVEGKDGRKFPSPQTMLDSLLGRLSFDPLAFTRMDARTQLNTLRGMVELDVDIDQLDAQNKIAYDKRTEVNRRVKALTAQRDAIEIVSGLPADLVNVTALVQELSSAAEHNSDIERQKRSRDDIMAGVVSTQCDAEDKRERAKKLLEEADELDARVTSGLESLSLMPDLPEPIDTVLVAAQIEEARTTNECIVRRNQRENLAGEVIAAEHESAALSGAILERDNLKSLTITNAKMPLEGLSFGEGEVTFGGLPLSQASDAEQLRISIAIAMAANPQLRVLRIRDGSLLDENSLRIVAEMAERNDYQVWIERVDTSGKVGVVMEDGEVKAVVS